MEIVFFLAWFSWATTFEKANEKAIIFASLNLIFQTQILIMKKSSFENCKTKSINLFLIAWITYPLPIVLFEWCSLQENNNRMEFFSKSHAIILSIVSNCRVSWENEAHYSVDDTSCWISSFFSNSHWRNELILWSTKETKKWCIHVLGRRKFRKYILKRGSTLCVRYVLQKVITNNKQ